MTVKELKEKLNEFDDRLLVFFRAGEGYNLLTDVYRGVNEADGCLFLDDCWDEDDWEEEDSAQDIRCGHWIIGQDGSYMCSECRNVFRYEINEYCSKCGAKLIYKED